MFEKGVPVKIGDRDFVLVYNVAAMQYITDKYGSVEGMVEGMGITEVPDGTEEDGTPKTRQVIDQKKLFREIPWIVSILANQGTMIESKCTKPDNPDFIDETYVSVFSMIPDFKPLANSIMEAVRKGNATEHESKNAEPAT